MALHNFAHVIAELVSNGKTYLEISNHLKDNGVRFGSSEANVKLFCRETGINRRRETLDRDEVNAVVGAAVRQVGPSYGRKMMTGHLSSHGIRIAERRVGIALKTVHSPYHEARQRGARNLNPIPYHAEYFGHKIHLDQNEKLSMFGVTHVLAIDGYSSKIVGSSVMPVKNNLTIYEEVYRSAVLAHGMWDQVRVDHGTEFYLVLFMQEKNQHLRGNRQPYIQTQSTRNHRIERMWPEVNQRVNYPIKSALVDMINGDTLDMDDNLVKFCVSSYCVQLCRLGMDKFVNSWNAHRIPGKGVPNILAATSAAINVDPADFPPCTTAAAMYTAELGSVLNAESVFGLDPFPSEQAKVACNIDFASYFPDINSIFTAVVNGDVVPFKQSLLKLIDLTRLHCITE